MTEPTPRRIVATYDLHTTDTPPDALAAAIALEQSVEVPQSLVDRRRPAAGRGGRGRRSRRRRGRARRRTSPSELRPVGRGGGRRAGARQPRVRQRLDDARGAARGSLVPRTRARRIRRPSTRRGRRARARRRARPPPARHRAQAAGGSREPARGDGGRLRARRGRHRQGRPEPHRRIRDVQGPGEAVRGRGGRREPAHGRRCLYLPHVTGPLPALERRFEYVARLGLPGVLAAPFIAGLGINRSLARDHDLMLMAHPTFAGGHFVSRGEGIDHGLLFGTLLRIAGADIAIFPNAGAGSSSPARTARTSRTGSARRSARCGPRGRVRPAG